jgi:hypothetical protein
MAIGHSRDIQAGKNAITLACLQRLFVCLHAYMISEKSLEPLTFSKHPRKWWGEDPSEALILLGAWCGAHTAETTRKKTGMRLRPQVGSGVCQMERNGKK